MAAQFATEAGDGPMDNALWRYALRVYSRSGVEALLLQMQDEHGADILQLLTVLWLSEQGLKVDEVSLSDNDYVSWKQEMIEPLRQRRRQADRLEHG
ncbi:MAG: TIGR02444 family protein, partial [Pseudomonadota bacterium]|nr:TIGR02444 family protein [Pseudomonadota bacterium]